MKSMEYSIDIVGPYPPPFGGISIHIYRMREHLISNKFKHRIYNHYYFEDLSNNIHSTNHSALWWMKFLITKHSPIVHFHQFSPLQFIYLFIFSLTNKSKLILTIHNEKILSYPPLIKFIIIYLARFTKFEHLIVVSERLCAFLKKNGVPNVKWLPAYIPPVEANKNLHLNNNEQDFIFFNAWRISNKNDFLVYGLDLLFKLARDRPTLKIKAFIGDLASRNYIDSLEEKNLIKNVFFVYGQSLVDNFTSAKLFLRLNRNDAYGISIQEALDLSVPAIASNVCTRPSGTVLFNPDDYSSLIEKVDAVLAGPKEIYLAGRKSTDYHTQLIKIYKSLIEEFD